MAFLHLLTTHVVLSRECCFAARLPAPSVDLSEDKMVIGKSLRTGIDWNSTDAISIKPLKETTVQERIVRMQTLGEAQLRMFRIAIDCTINKTPATIWGPGVYELPRPLAWLFEPIVVTCNFFVLTLRLCDDEGFVLKTRPGSMDWAWMLPGDRFQHYEDLRCKVLGLPVSQWPGSILLCDGAIITMDQKVTKYSV